MDSNEAFIPCKSGTTKLHELTDLAYPLINKDGLENEPPTHQRGSQRIDFIFCNLGIEKFISRIGILPMHDIVPSDHRAIYFDINLVAWLKDPGLQSIITIRLLSTNSLDLTRVYDKYLDIYLKKNDIITKV